MNDAALSQIFDAVWQAWQQAVAGRHDAFHTAMVGTTSPHGPQMRTVILRQADRSTGSLFFHTDRRSPKVAELQADARLAWLFYDAERKLQIRASGLATLHMLDDVARERWEASALTSRRCYLAPFAPGEIVVAEHPNLPEQWRERVPSSAESADGLANFCVVACRLQMIEWLFLRAAGHQRARFLTQGETWQGQWLAP